MFDSNRRKYPRVTVPCQITIWLNNGGNETIMAQTANIGLGGVCIHIHQGVDVGTKVDVRLTFSNTSTPLKCRGMVVRSFKENEKYYNVGIQFDPLDELKNAFLVGQVSMLMEQEQKGKH